MKHNRKYRTDKLIRLLPPRQHPNTFLNKRPGNIPIAHILHLAAISPFQIAKILKLHPPPILLNKLILKFLFECKIADELIEDVEVLLVVGAGDQPGFLEQVGRELGVVYAVGRRVHRDPQVLPEARAVVVADRLAVAEPLQDWVAYLYRFLDLVLYLTVRTTQLLVVIVYESQALLVCLGLART
jgi:hypothetical protein